MCPSVLSLTEVTRRQGLQNLSKLDVAMLDITCSTIQIAYREKYTS